MGFLKQLLSYNRICIQCHNNPDADALASALGVYRYLCAHGVDAAVVYGGDQLIHKTSIKMLVSECGLPVEHVDSISGFDLLLLVDCQYGQSNVVQFSAPEVALIDHHVQVVESKERYLIKSEYQSCSAVVYDLLREEGYPVKEDETLAVALLYGLYIDTASFADLFSSADIAMRTNLYAEQPLFESLVKSTMSTEELMIASEAMANHYFDVKRHIAIIGALQCEQTVLGMIGDFMIQVDSVYLSFAYTEADVGYQISLRTCHDMLPANHIAEYVCRGIGGGGGHNRKAGGRIQKDKLQEKYGDKSFFEVAEMLLRRYFEENCIQL